MTQQEKDELIDHFLKGFETSTEMGFVQFQFLNQSIPEHLRKYSHDNASRIMMSNGLLILSKALNENGYSLTEFGSEVIRDGGWLRYLSNKRENERLLRLQISSGITTNSSVKDTNEFQKKILKSTLGVSILALIVAAIGVYVTQSSGESQTILLRRLEGLEKQKQKWKADSLKMTLSYRTSVDSIKTLIPDSLHKGTK